MNGRDFVPPRSVHVPPPLLSGLAMESHRLGASAAAGRISSSPGHLDAGHPVALHSGKFPSPAITIHSQHSDAFPGASGFLCDLMSLSNPHVGPAPLPSDPAFRAPNPASLQMAQLWAFHLHKAPNHEDEKQADEQTHRHDCLLSGSLEREREREQEKVLRESNGLADYTQVASASVLIPNLMVTGGPSLGEDHWATDPTSHLASHPWLPCSGATSMWLPGSPYVYFTPQALLTCQDFPSSLRGLCWKSTSVQDPQTGQLVLIPTEHLPHYKLEMLERGPPLWSAVYPPAGSCLQHTHELQLLSHQQLMRQQQLYMIQQEASPVMELQRNASFMERLKEQPANLEDKSEKRGGEAAKGSLLGISAPVLHGCKPRPSSLTPSTSYRTARMAQTPLPVTPLPSPVTTLRSKERPKGENTLLQLSFWHPSSPASASPPPPSPICPKQESVEVPEKDELNLQKRASASFPCLYPEIPCGYPYESVTASFGRHYPHLHQPAAGANGLALAGPLQAEQRLAMPPDIKPRHLCSPVPAEASREPKPIEEPNLDHSKEVLGWDCSMEPLQPAPLLRGQDPSAPSKEKSCLAAAASPLPQENEEDQDDKVDIASSSHQGLCQILGVESDGVPAVGEAESPLPFPEATHVHSSSNYSDSRPTECRSGLPSVLVDRFLPVHDLQESTSCDTPDLESTDDNLALSSSNVTTLHPTLVPLPILPEYPMAGMFALVTASEMPQAGALATLTEMASPGAVPLNLLEMSATEGMSRPERDVVQGKAEEWAEMVRTGLMHYGLESLLRAGRQVLLDTVEWQPQVSVRLPRELDPNKKYSWRQKDKPMFSKSSLEAMDAIEVDYRVRLAELQHRYKDKQRELFRLQRHRDEAEKQQQLHQQCEERSRGLAKRGPGRPPKRKLGLGVPSPPSGKLNTKCGKSSLYSEDSESREMLRKRSRAPNREEEDADGNVLRPKKRSRSWHEQESSSSYSLEVSKAVRKKSQVSEQKQLALKLNKALSFTKLSKLNKVSCKLAESPSGSIRAIPGNGLPAPLDMDMRNNMAKSSLAKDLNLFHKSSKEEYFTEREDYEDYDDDDKEEEEEAELDESDGLCSSSLKESGLGLLACFAASAIPSPVTSSPLSLVHLKAKQKATKEERQSLLGVESEFSDSESEVKICQFPSLLHGKRSVQELPLLPPANVQREDSSPSRRCRKPKAPKLGLDFPADGSAEAHWTRHRSERILLHDTAQANPFSPTTPKTLHRAKTPPQGSKGLPSAREAKALVKKKRVKESPLRLPPPQLSSTPSDSSSARPVCPGRKSKVNPKAREQARGKCCAVSKLMESMAVDEDFEPNQDSSFSEDENPPPITLPERPCTPAPRHCVIDKDGLRVLIPMDEQLLYAGHINTVHSPDIYRVVVEGERGNRPHIYCLEQLLQEAIIDVKPPSVRYLPQGTRIAAYWSQQYRCLYPGTVVRGSPDMDEVDNLITVEFDDGDTGRILLSHIRLLPPGYKIQCAEPSPALLVACTKRRSRKCVKDVSESKETKSPEDPALKDRGRGRKPKTEPEVFPKEHEKPDASVPSHALERPLSAQKNCSRPGKTSLSATTTGSSIPMPTESQKKATLTKPAAKMRSQPHSVYLSAFYRQVMSVDLYNDPSTLLASFVTSNDSGEAKPVKQTRKSKEEGAGFGVKAQRKQPEAEILIKLDHEGVMSPKTKKTKALMMMMERQNSAKTDNKAMMSVGYATLATAISADKKLKPKRKPEQEAVSTDSLAAYGIHKPGGGSEHPAKVKSSKEKEEEEEEAQSASSNSCSSESEGEEERSTSPLKVAKRDSSSTSCCASSPTSPSSSSSSSSSSAGFSCSSSSSPTSEEESSCSSVEEAPTVPQPHYPQEQASAQEEEEDAEEMMEVKSEPPATSPKAKKQQAIPKQQQKQQMVKKSAGRPKREDVHLSTTKALAKRQRLPSVENRPKISAFLPARQLWKWFGKPTQRWGMKGKVKKLFYKAIMRGKEMIHIGDCAVFLSAGRPNLPFIGHIHSMWESWGNNMVVRVKWFYHPEETNPGKKLHDKKNWDRMSGRSLRAVLQDSNQRKDFMERALYQSSHIDENDVQTISHKCLVVSLEQYEQMVKTKKYQDSEDLYYLVGTYKPTTGMIFSTDGIPVIY